MYYYASVGVIRLNIIKELKRSYLKDYLLFTVGRIEKEAKLYKRWDSTPEILIVLTKLLLIYYPILVDDKTIEKLKLVRIQTQFENMKILEEYCHEYMKQTRSFISGEVNNRPRIDFSNKTKLYERDISLLHFLELENVLQLKEKLESLVVLSEQLDDHLKDVSEARRKILLNILRDVISPVYFVIEQIYEAI